MSAGEAGERRSPPPARGSGATPPNKQTHTHPPPPPTRARRRGLSTRVAAFSKRVTGEGEALADEVASLSQRVERSLGAATRRLSDDDDWIGESVCICMGGGGGWAWGRRSMAPPHAHATNTPHPAASSPPHASPTPDVIHNLQTARGVLRGNGPGGDL